MYSSVLATATDVRWQALTHAVGAPAAPTVQCVHPRAGAVAALVSGGRVIVAGAWTLLFHLVVRPFGLSEIWFSASYDGGAMCYLLVFDFAFPIELQFTLAQMNYAYILISAFINTVYEL